MWDEDQPTNRGSEEALDLGLSPEDGDILAIFGSVILVKLDKDSNLLWAYAGRPHHDLFVHPSGDIDVLTREHRIVPFISKKRKVWDDYCIRLTSKGEEIWRISVFDALSLGHQQGLIDAG